MGQPKIDRIDISDYRGIEQAEDQRYEYHDGELFRMAGGTVAHTQLCGNSFGVLRDAVRSTGTCIAFTSEMKIEIEPGGRYVYPDAGLACPKLIESKQLTGAINNPRLIVEVTSKDSGNYDRGPKLRYYFSLPSLMEYLLVDQDRPSVTVFRRRGDLMKLDHYGGLDATIELEGLQASISLAELYENVELPEIEEPMVDER